ncbi:MAG: D-2-hydroxyacid dehydrogenase [Chloroflexota bacterium]|nr:D-2-hydroxyacid dehydrogenase [Chloroflexota bacterium]MDE3103237.1 D-2-hydroxyacid dehydrogenase [Chloroflexota bacterium]
MTTIAVLGWFPSLPADLEKALPDDRIVRFERRGPFDGAHSIEVALGAPSGDLIHEFMSRAPRLRWMHTMSAGVENFLIPELVERTDLTLTNNSGPYDIPVAEHVMAVMLAAAKHLPDYQRSQERAHWDKDHHHIELRGATVVVLGLGSIGGEVARLASAFGMRVVGVRRRLDLPGIPGVTEVVPPERLADVAAGADFLVVATPLTRTTRGIVSGDVLTRMKRTAWLVNIARGPVVDERALLEAVKERHIAGAAIDAWWKEPLPADSEWWKLENVIVTPHVSHSSPLVKERTLALFLENLRRWKAGEPLLNVVDVHAGY